MRMVAASQLFATVVADIGLEFGIRARTVDERGHHLLHTHTRRTTLRGMRAKNGQIQLVTRATEGRVTKGGAYLQGAGVRRVAERATYCF
jgi:hypothetical protein